MGRGREAVMAAYDFMRVSVSPKSAADWPEGVLPPSDATLFPPMARQQRQQQRQGADGARGGARARGGELLPAGGGPLYPAEAESLLLARFGTGGRTYQSRRKQ